MLFIMRKGVVGFASDQQTGRHAPRTVFYYFIWGGRGKIAQGCRFPSSVSNENSNAARILRANEIYDEDILDRYCN